MLQRQRDRIEFCEHNEAAVLKSMTQLIDLDNILSDYGGNGPAFESFKQTFPPQYQ